MDYGIQIYMPQLNSVSFAKDKQSVTLGGGINSKNLTDALWAVGKQTGKQHKVAVYEDTSLNSVQSLEPANASAIWVPLLAVGMVGCRVATASSLIRFSL